MEKQVTSQNPADTGHECVPVENSAPTEEESKPSEAVVNNCGDCKQETKQKKESATTKGTASEFSEGITQSANTNEDGSCENLGSDPAPCQEQTVTAATALSSQGVDCSDTIQDTGHECVPFEDSAPTEKESKPSEASEFSEGITQSANTNEDGSCENLGSDPAPCQEQTVTAATALSSQGVDCSDTIQDTGHECVPFEDSAPTEEESKPSEASEFSEGITQSANTNEDGSCENLGSDPAPCQEQTVTAATALSSQGVDCSDTIQDTGHECVPFEDSAPTEKESKPSEASEFSEGITQSANTNEDGSCENLGSDPAPCQEQTVTAATALSSQGVDCSDTIQDTGHECVPFEDSAPTEKESKPSEASEFSEGITQSANTNEDGSCENLGSDPAPCQEQTVTAGVDCSDTIQDESCVTKNEPSELTPSQIPNDKKDNQVDEPEPELNENISTKNNSDNHFGDASEERQDKPESTTQHTQQLDDRSNDVENIGPTTPEASQTEEPQVTSEFSEGITQSANTNEDRSCENLGSDPAPCQEQTVTAATALSSQGVDCSDTIQDTGHECVPFEDSAPTEEESKPSEASEFSEGITQSANTNEDGSCENLGSDPAPCQEQTVTAATALSSQGVDCSDTIQDESCVTKNEPSELTPSQIPNDKKDNQVDEPEPELNENISTKNNSDNHFGDASEERQDKPESTTQHTQQLDDRSNDVENIGPTTPEASQTEEPQVTSEFSEGITQSANTNEDRSCENLGSDPAPCQEQTVTAATALSSQGVDCSDTIQDTGHECVPFEDSAPTEEESKPSEASEFSEGITQSANTNEDGSCENLGSDPAPCQEQTVTAATALSSQGVDCSDTIQDTGHECVPFEDSAPTEEESKPSEASEFSEGITQSANTNEDGSCENLGSDPAPCQEQTVTAATALSSQGVDCSDTIQDTGHECVPFEDSAPTEKESKPSEASEFSEGITQSANTNEDGSCENLGSDPAPCQEQTVTAGVDCSDTIQDTGHECVPFEDSAPTEEESKPSEASEFSEGITQSANTNEDGSCENLGSDPAPCQEQTVTAATALSSQGVDCSDTIQDTGHECVPFEDSAPTEKESKPSEASEFSEGITQSANTNEDGSCENLGSDPAPCQEQTVTAATALSSQGVDCSDTIQDESCVTKNEPSELTPSQIPNDKKDNQVDEPEPELNENISTKNNSDNHFGDASEERQDKPESTTQHTQQLDDRSNDVENIGPTTPEASQTEEPQVTSEFSEGITQSANTNEDRSCENLGSDPAPCQEQTVTAATALSSQGVDCSDTIQDESCVTKNEPSELTPSQIPNDKKDNQVDEPEPELNENISTKNNSDNHFGDASEERQDKPESTTQHTQQLDDRSNDVENIGPTTPEASQTEEPQVTSVQSPQF
ncbi:uncharacterized protein LOC134621288 [Pelmatolapia mariae]|uniref:uncharacterized protein LOC134621288 n=1 Tax=Pelmatolapia mariae TaxID=158779 RepID=UPI003211E546